MLQVLLVMQPLRYSRVRVLVTSSGPSPPSPHVCQEVDITYMYLHSKNLNLYLSVQVVQVLEASVHSVIVTLYPGLSSVAGVRCPCLASKVSSPLCCTDPPQPRVPGLLQPQDQAVPGPQLPAPAAPAPVSRQHQRVVRILQGGHLVLYFV